jgi:hypothetical protein
LENKNGSDKQVGRRRVLQLVGVGLGVGLGAGSLLGLEGCKDKGSEGASSSGGGTGTGTAPATGGKDCKSPLDDTSKGLRRTLQYKAKADDPAKQCSGCAQFQPGAYADCGGCKLITGPVRAEGGCLSFAPIGGEGGAPKPG